MMTCSSSAKRISGDLCAAQDRGNSPKQTNRKQMSALILGARRAASVYVYIVKSFLISDSSRERH